MRYTYSWVYFCVQYLLSVIVEISNCVFAINGTPFIPARRNMHIFETQNLGVRCPSLFQTSTDSEGVEFLVDFIFTNVVTGRLNLDVCMCVCVGWLRMCGYRKNECVLKAEVINVIGMKEALGQRHLLCDIIKAILFLTHFNKIFKTVKLII